MKYLGTLTLVALFICAPISTFAAEPILKAKLSDDTRMLTVQYRNLPEGTFAITNKKGTEIRRAVKRNDTAGTKKISLPKDMGVGTYTITALDEDMKVATSTTFAITYIDPPVCTLRASTKVADRGDTITLRWTSKNADTVSVFNGFRKGTHGTVRVSVNHPGVHPYVAHAQGKGGLSSCSTKVRVK